MQLHWLDATATAQLIRSGEVSAEAVLEAYLARVARINPQLNCIVSLDEAGARARAREADAALAAGNMLGPLHGVPITIKDTFEVVGMPCTAGSRTLATHWPTKTATAVQRLIDAGAVVFGKTNVPEFAGDVQTSNDLHGTTSNAWHMERSAGGSSGGSAVALAAGLTALELGSDLGGSSRLPAHFNGIFGMRPTWGFIPTTGHIPAAPGSLVQDEFNCVGPMARSARDLRLMMDLASGSDPLYGESVRMGLPDRDLPPLGALRLATWMDDACGPLASEVRSVLARAVESIRAAGVMQVANAHPDIDAREAFHLCMSMLGATTAARKSAEERAALKVLGDSLRDVPVNARKQFVLGSQMSYADFRAATQRRNEIRVRWADFFRRFDALLSPAIGVAALTHAPNFFDRILTVDGQTSTGREHLFWTSHQVLASLPSVVVPAGFTDEGLPVGLQITTGHAEDYKAIRLAEAFASLLGVAEQRPAAWA